MIKREIWQREDKLCIKEEEGKERREEKRIEVKKINGRLTVT